MRKAIRITLIVLLFALIIIQFFRPSKNISEGIAVNDITTKYAIPESLQATFKVACRDCHSNNSRYPWYWSLQPFAWFLNGHIEEGKRQLNLSIFTSYKIGRQYKLFDEINKEVKGGDMPLSSYTLIHRDAVLTDAQKQEITDWTSASRKQIEGFYPPDSLKRNKPAPPPL
ncbi:MAG: heme-binding domain-containing protein [Bacteroidota bacterium]|nr:heme-binding domain-containing protein [Bacteroidota bacterium]